MTNVERAAAVRGKTIRMMWTAGPTKGSTHEHVFHQDGTVEWYDPGTRKSSAGYTLTLVLNFREKTRVGFASSSNDWHPVQGTFQVVQ
jgi:hypothetical protein